LNRGYGFGYGWLHVFTHNNAREHLSTDYRNLIFIDFSYWNTAWSSLNAPIYRKQVSTELLKRSSSKIDGVFSYVLSNQKDQRLMNKKILYLNPLDLIKWNKKYLDFLIDWENCAILDS